MLSVGGMRSKAGLTLNSSISTMPLSAAQAMVDRVALFCEKNAEVEKTLDGAVKKFKENSLRLTGGRQSIVGAARKAIDHGVPEPISHLLPPLSEIQ